MSAQTPNPSNDPTIAHLLQQGERLVRIETKIDVYSENVSEVKRRLEITDATANRADNCSVQNTKDIVELKDSHKWFFRCGVGVGLMALANIIISLLP